MYICVSFLWVPLPNTIYYHIICDSQTCVCLEPLHSLQIHWEIGLYLYICKSTCISLYVRHQSSYTWTGLSCLKSYWKKGLAITLNRCDGSARKIGWGIITFSSIQRSSNVSAPGITLPLCHHCVLETDSYTTVGGRIDVWFSFHVLPYHSPETRNYAQTRAHNC